MEIKYEEGIQDFTSMICTTDYSLDKIKTTHLKSVDICCERICEFAINKIFSFKVCPYCGEEIKKVKI